MKKMLLAVLLGTAQVAAADVYRPGFMPDLDPTREPFCIPRTIVFGYQPGRNGVPYVCYDLRKPLGLGELEWPEHSDNSQSVTPELPERPQLYWTEDQLTQWELGRPVLACCNGLVHQGG